MPRPTIDALRQIKMRMYWQSGAPHGPTGDHFKTVADCQSDDPPRLNGRLALPCPRDSSR